MAHAAEVQPQINRPAYTDPGPGDNQLPDSPGGRSDEEAGVQSSIALDHSAGSQFDFIRIMPFRSMKVVINEKPLETMTDSGAQTVLLNRAALPDNNICTVVKFGYKVFLAIQSLLILHLLK